ncbi:ABC transporter permease [Candidatus Woesebacteria bacterium]|jgi:putative ABC transport system permease protein|nr:ABC transporter permease [Candidatus Woesebacteria bacterium]MBP9687108.1 ABC transporter permease [Candidatus Woesebacteria bacterium]
MDFYELILESVNTLTVNKLRTGLATLGIVIGIGSVIALVSLGQATQQSVQNQIQSLGANLITVSPGSLQAGPVRGAQGGGTTLTLQDAEAIKTSSEITTIKTVSPEYSGRLQVTTGSANTNTQIIGATEAYLTVHKVSIDQGVFITDRDNDSMSKVAVVGPTVATNLFGDGVNPIGNTIRIGSQSFVIVGITVSKGGTGFLNQDDVIYVPLSTAQKQLFGKTNVTSIALEAKSSEVMTAAQDQVGYFLLSRHKISDPTKADFSIFSQQDILNTASATTGTFTTLLSGVAAISLLVGGIGIMNIMLVTVTERTREIGLRKALGAKKNVITAQFLIESIILTFTGGGIGVLLGILTSYLISIVTSSLFVVSPGSVLLAFLVSGGIGILFGWYPAQRAANLQPIEALRYE